MNPSAHQLHAVLLTVFLVMSLAAQCAASAGGPASSNYAIAWDVLGAGGASSSSPNYHLSDAIAQPATAGAAAGVNYVLVAGFHSPPDYDEDGLRNFVDNCSQDSNADQRDSNADGYGNACDPDLNDDNITNVIDLGILRSRFFTGDADADFNGDGVVNAIDLGAMKSRFFAMPGPSGLAD